MATREALEQMAIRKSLKAGGKSEAEVSKMMRDIRKGSHVTAMEVFDFLSPVDRKRITEYGKSIAAGESKKVASMAAEDAAVAALMVALGFGAKTAMKAGKKAFKMRKAQKSADKAAKTANQQRVDKTFTKPKPRINKRKEHSYKLTQATEGDVAGIAAAARVAAKHKGEVWEVPKSLIKKPAPKPNVRKKRGSPGGGEVTEKTKSTGREIRKDPAVRARQKAAKQMKKEAGRKRLHDKLITDKETFEANLRATHGRENTLLRYLSANLKKGERSPYRQKEYNELLSELKKVIHKSRRLGVKSDKRKKKEIIEQLNSPEMRMQREAQRKQRLRRKEIVQKADIMPEHLKRREWTMDLIASTYEQISALGKLLPFAPAAKKAEIKKSIKEARQRIKDWKAALKSAGMDEN